MANRKEQTELFRLHREQSSLFAEMGGKENPLLMNDPRYADAGVLAPASAADLAFVLHMYYHLKDTGCCAIVEFPGVLYRGGAGRYSRNNQYRRGQCQVGNFDCRR